MNPVNNSFKFVVCIYLSINNKKETLITTEKLLKINFMKEKVKKISHELHLVYMEVYINYVHIWWNLRKSICRFLSFLKKFIPSFMDILSVFFFNSSYWQLLATRGLFITSGITKLKIFIFIEKIIRNAIELLFSYTCVAVYIYQHIIIIIILIKMSDELNEFIRICWSHCCCN